MQLQALVGCTKEKSSTGLFATSINMNGWGMVVFRDDLKRHRYTSTFFPGIVDDVLNVCCLMYHCVLFLRILYHFSFLGYWSWCSTVAVGFGWADGTVGLG